MYSNESQDKKQWEIDELDDIFFQRSESDICAITEQRCSPKHKRNFSDVDSLGYNGSRTYKTKQNFLKSIQSCLNWEAQKSQINEKYQNLILRGSQPELKELSKLQTVDEHVEWGMEKRAVEEQIQQLEHKRQMEEVENQIQEQRLKEVRDKETQRRSAFLRREETQQMVETPYEVKHMVTFDHKRTERTITIDMVETTASQISLFDQSQQSNSINYQKPQLKQRGCYSPSKISDSTADTFQQAFANCKNYRYINTPSPTKMRRKNINFNSVGDNVIKPNFQIKPNVTESLNVGTLSQMKSMDQRKLFAPRTPNHKRLVNFKSKLMRKIEEKSSNSPSRYSDRRAMGHYNENYSPSMRMTHLMKSEYDQIERNMLQNF